MTFSHERYLCRMIDIIMEKNKTFFTGVKPPKITDVKKYNKAVLWNINQKYLYEMTNFYDDPMDENGNYHYGHFDEYFTDPKRNGESYQMVMERLFKALDHIFEQHDIDSDKNLLIISHGAVIMTLLAMKRDIPFEQSHTIEVDNATPIEFSIEELEEIRKKL